MLAEAKAADALVDLALVALYPPVHHVYDRVHCRDSIGAPLLTPEHRTAYVQSQLCHDSGVLVPGVLAGQLYSDCGNAS